MGKLSELCIRRNVTTFYFRSKTAKKIEEVKSIGKLFLFQSFGIWVYFTATVQLLQNPLKNINDI